jgi:ketosteroid isomerase-like protein
MTNTQIIQKLYENFGKKDIPAVIDMFADDAVFEDYAALWIDGKPNLVPTAGRYEGKNGIVMFFTKMAESWDVTKLEPVKFFESGKEVIALLNLAGNFKTNGISAENGWVMIWGLDAGKIKSTRITTVPGMF